MKLRSRGRGGGYSLRRGLTESLLAVLYRGDWAARLWGALRRPGVTVVRHRLELARGCGRSCRIAFLSDLHVGPTTPASLLEQARLAIEREAPDVVLLGGDYVFLDAEPHRLDALRAFVGSLACPVKLAVVGNHDLWTYDAEIVAALTAGGARVLINESATLPHPWTDVSIVGLDDPWTGRCDPGAALAGVDGRTGGEQAAFRVILCHSPDVLRLLEGVGFDLLLAGHTHGGHIATPWGPIVMPHGRLCRRFAAGIARSGGGTVYVSRGIGGVELPIRAFAPPEVLLLELARPPSVPESARDPGRDPR